MNKQVINIFVDTNDVVQKAIDNIFYNHTTIYTTDLSDAHIIITDKESYTQSPKDNIPVLILGVDIFIPTKITILKKTIIAIVQNQQVNTPLSKGKICLYPYTGTLLIGKNTVELTDKEINIMQEFLTVGTVSRDDLLKNVWGYHVDMDTHTVQTHIYRLKKKCKCSLIITNDKGEYTLNHALI